jgi:lysophospholipase L1-like esterase
MTAKAKSIAGGLIALTFSSILCLVFVEIIFRTVLSEERLKPKEWSDRPKSYYLPHDAVTAQEGPHTPQKAAGVFRIAVVGDSFAFAPYMQFDDTFSKRLERMLNLGTSKIEVINYGVPRYSTSHEIALAKKAIEEQADLIILQICLNDPEIKPYTPTGLIGGVVDRFGGIQYTSGILSWWKTGAFVAKRFYNSDSRDKYVKYFFKLWQGKDTLKNFTDSYEQIRNITTTAKVPLVSVVFPLFGLPVDDKYPFIEIHQIVNRISTDFGITYLDLLSAYQGLPIERLQVIVGKDFHPNEIGHRIASEEIYDFLAAKKLIPDGALITKSVKERTSINLDK